MQLKPPPIILHIPHASHYIPENVRDQFLLPEDELGLELVRMTDAFTDNLFEFSDDIALAVSFPVSRLVLDPERFEDDSREIMAQKGMGIIYTRTAMGAPLRRPLTEAERRELLVEYHHPHHDRLNTAVKNSLEHHDRCLILDAHSFPSQPLPYELNQSPARPEICIGTDPFHTDKATANRLVDLFRVAGFSVEVNRPFAGALVPSAFYKKDPRVQSIMIEVRRDLYMNEFTGQKIPGYDILKKDLLNILDEFTAGIFFKTSA